MKRVLNPLLLIGIGVGAMYFYDPSHGRRRRAIARDKVTSIMHRGACAWNKTREDLNNRGKGLLASFTGLFKSRETSDEKIAARIQSKLGRVVSHPHAIKVTVNSGCAILRGPILADEVKELIASTGSVCGVKAVENQLDVHNDAGYVPALQGGCSPARSKFLLAKEHWPPAARLVTGAAGAGAMIYGLSRGGILGKGIALCGCGLVIRAATNLDVSRLTGIGAGTRAVDLRKTITINAPIEEVFNFWANFRNLPKFMGHVKEVSSLGGGRSHWTVAGPGGTPIQWTARETEFVPYQLLAWQTEAGSSVEHTGLVRFAPTSSGGTRLDIFMSYNPVAGAIGHMIAKLLGSDPKHTLDNDLVRFKSLLEQGKATVGRQSVRRDELVEGP